MEIRPIMVMVEKEAGTGEFEKFLFQDWVLFGTTMEATDNVTPGGKPVWNASLQLFLSTNSSVDRMLSLFHWFSKKWPAVLADLTGKESAVIAPSAGQVISINKKK